MNPIELSFLGEPAPSADPRDIALIAAECVTRISDLVGPLYTMDPAIGALHVPAPSFAGPALTVKCPPGDNLAVIAAIDMARPGEVLVVDNRGHTGACLGGALLAGYAVERKMMSGVVADGGFRDIEEIGKAGLPVVARAAVAWSGPKNGPGEINVPVHCGGVVVQPGDIVRVSGEGIAVVPLRLLKAVVTALREGPPEIAPGQIQDFVGRIAEKFLRLAGRSSRLDG